MALHIPGFKFTLTPQAVSDSVAYVGELMAGGLTYGDAIDRAADLIDGMLVFQNSISESLDGPIIRAGLRLAVGLAGGPDAVVNRAYELRKSLATPPRAAYPTPR